MAVGNRRPDGSIIVHELKLKHFMENDSRAVRFYELLGDLKQQVRGVT